MLAQKVSCCVASALLVFLVAIALNASTPIPGLGQALPKRQAIKSIEQRGVLVQVSGEVDIYALAVFSKTDDVAWRCRASLEKLAPGLWFGSIAIPGGHDDLQIGIDLKVKREDKLVWCSNGKELRFTDLIKLDAKEISDPKEFYTLDFNRMDLVWMEIDLEKSDAEKTVEVKLWQHWSVGSGPWSTSFMALGGGKWLGSERAYPLYMDETELTGYLEFVHADGTSRKTESLTLSKLGVKVLKRIENQ